MHALIVVDMQNDFMPKGALGIPGADSLIPKINQLMEKFPLVFATKDWHPIDHVSFYTNHPGYKVGDVILVNDIEQILWPVHCVQDTKGADFAIGLDQSHIDQIFYKGVDSSIDSYSTFFDNAHLRNTGLANELKKRKVDTIFIVGVATDYCVLYSVLDALALGFKVEVIRDACSAINLQKGDEEKALEMMQQKGAHIVTIQEVFA